MFNVTEVKQDFGSKGLFTMTQVHAVPPETGLAQVCSCVQQGWAINIVVAGVHAAPSSDDAQQPRKMRQLKPPQVCTAPLQHSPVSLQSCFCLVNR